MLLQAVWLCLVLLMTFLTLQKNKCSQDKSHITPIILILSFGAIAVVSYLLNFNLSGAINRIFTYVFVYFLILYIFLDITKHFNIFSLIRPFTISSVILVIMNLLTYFGYTLPFIDNGNNLDQLSSDQINVQLNSFSGTTNNPNRLAVTLLIASSSLYISTLDKSINKYFKLILYLILTISLILLLFTFSRGGIVSVTVIILLYIVRNYRKKSNIFNVGVIFVGCTIAYIKLIEYFNRIGTRFSESGTSSRSDIWLDAINVALENPLIGVGEYTFELNPGVFFRAHNVYLHVIASFGIIAGILWCLWILYGLMSAISNYLNPKSVSLEKPLIFSAATFIGIFIHQMVEASVVNPWLPFTSFFLLIYACNVNAKKTNLYA